MRLVSIYLSLLALVSNFNFSSASELLKRECAANNCLREVRGAGTIGSSDCSSYLASSTTTITITITPGLGRTVTASTTTKTVQTTTTRTILTTSVVKVVEFTFTAIVSTSIIPDLKRRAAKTVPTYASDCAVDEYTSACSCYGVFPPHTKTETAHSVPPDTIIKTITTTISFQATITNSLITTTTSTSFRPRYTTIVLEASSFALYIVGGPYDGYYLVAADDTTGLYTTEIFINNAFVLPSFFTLKSGNLYYSDQYIAVAGVDEYNYLAFAAPGYYGADPPPLVCSVSGGFLGCETSQGDTIFYACPDETGEGFPPAVYFFSTTDTVPTTCSPISVKQLLA